MVHFRLLLFALALRKFTELDERCYFGRKTGDEHKLNFVAVTVQLLYLFNSTHSPIPTLTGNFETRKKDYAYSTDFLEKQSREVEICNFSTLATNLPTLTLSNPVVYLFCLLYLYVDLY